MATNIFDTIKDTASELTSQVFGAEYSNYGSALLNKLNAGLTSTSLEEKRYEQTTDVFPEDLGMDYYSHYMKIRAFTGGSGTSGSLTFQEPNYEAWNGYVFIPGGGGGGQPPLIYDHKHAYTDIRLTNIINDSTLGITASLATKRSINPMVQVLYRSTNLRQFDFSIFMAPRSQREANAMYNIQKKMRMFSAPEINGGVVIAPGEFQIEFYNKGQPDDNLPKLERCIITNVTSNFASQGDYSSFRDGMPVSCLLTFSATEVKIVDRNRIQQGY